VFSVISSRIIVPEIRAVVRLVRSIVSFGREEPYVEGAICAGRARDDLIRHILSNTTRADRAGTFILRQTRS